MKQNPDQIFHSKILLFGEYSLMFGSMALSIPFKKFGGRFAYNPAHQDAEEENSSFQVEDYLNYIESVCEKDESGFVLDIKRLRNDLSSGYVFESSIPISYGLGSSGALVAAIFSRYGGAQVQDFINPYQIKLLKAFFSKLESYFHGKSSGLDPLLSYLDHPLLIDENGEIELVSVPNQEENNQGSVFLIDSETSSETQPLVDLFIKKCEDNQFNTEIRSTYIPAVNACIRAYLKVDNQALYENLNKLSAFQYQFFLEMIPDTIKQIWKNGIDSENYTLKLCGSGGGGMILGFTREFKLAKHELKDYPITKVHPI